MSKAGNPNLITGEHIVGMKTGKRKLAAAVALGAKAGEAAAALAYPIPFMKLDTPDVRELLAGLQALLPVAERIDASRGRSLDEPVGGSAGCDIAEDLAQMIACLDLELYGHSERVMGGRE